MGEVLIEQLKVISQDPLLLKSIVLVIGYFIIKRVLLNKVMKKPNLNQVEKVNYAKSLSTYMNILFGFLFIFIWFSQIQTVVVSLFAVAAALVIATKELIMNIMGGVLIRLHSFYRIGDRIEIDGIRGIVTEKSLAVTKVLVIGPESYSQQTTGEIVFIPNSKMLSHHFKNDSYFKGYTIKSFNYKCEADMNVEVLEEEVLQWGETVCAPYIDEAKRNIEKFCRSEGFLLPSISPRTKLALNDEGGLEVVLKMPVKNNKVADIEQLLIRKYIAFKKQNQK